MTTIAAHGKTIAADTQSTYGDGRRVPCCKLYRKQITIRSEVWEIIIGTAGADYSGELFVSWYDGNPEKPPPEIFSHLGPDEDFECILLHPDGIYTINRLCHPVKQLAEFVAVGSGAKAAIGALKAGAGQRGEDIDSESGLPHMAHVSCNVRMLTLFARTYPEGDDRPKQWLADKTDGSA